MEELRPENNENKGEKRKEALREKREQVREEIREVVEEKREKLKVNKFAVTLIKALYIVLIPLIILLVIFVVIMASDLVTEIYATENATSVNVFDTSVNNEAMQISNLALRYSNDANINTKLVAGSGTAIEQLVSNEVKGYGYYAIFYNLDGSVLASVGTLPADTAIKLPANKSDYSDYFTDTLIPLSYRCYMKISDGSKTLGFIQIGYSLEDLTLVDKIKQQVSSEVTIFAGDKRIATTIIGADGNRVIGTAMDAAIAQKVITDGERTTGKGIIVNERMVYTYEPIKNQQGQVLGALFVGNPLSYMQTKLAGIAGQGIVISILLMACCLTLIAFKLVKNKLSVPLRSVVELAENIEHGNLQVEKLDIVAKNEAGQLANAMNNTVIALNSYIGDISNMLTKMSDRDFTVESNAQYEGDFDALQKAALRIKKHTCRFITILNEMATEINSSAEHIASASQQVATGTTEQASTIEELSSSIIEVSNNVDRNAENAHSAKQLSDDVSKNISEQSQQMQEMLDAMKDIEDKSAEIQKIIKTIDNIAFQTNILALNAAVEAARAGDAGKGFAVVADEVRNLASKSADAANNTTTLIQASIASVQHGSEIAKIAASSLENVVSLTGNTHSMIDNISVQSEQQAFAIRQITEAIEQISSVVQSNSAIAEETMAASQELDTKARELKAILDRYTV